MKNEYIIAKMWNVIIAAVDEGQTSWITIFSMNKICQKWIFSEKLNGNPKNDERIA